MKLRDHLYENYHPKGRLGRFLWPFILTVCSTYVAGFWAAHVAEHGKLGHGWVEPAVMLAGWTLIAVLAARQLGRLIRQLLLRRPT